MTLTASGRRLRLPTRYEPADSSRSAFVRGWLPMGSAVANAFRSNGLMNISTGTVGTATRLASATEKIVIQRFFAACAAPVASTPPGPERVLDRLEQHVSLPIGSRPLEHYVRVYMLLTSSNVGAFHWRTPPLLDRPRLIGIYSDGPYGGCDLILVYDLGAERVESIKCNGS